MQKIRCLLVTALCLLMIGCLSGRRAETFSPSPRSTSEGTSPEPSGSTPPPEYKPPPLLKPLYLGVVRAPREHRDWFSGFRVTLPRQWLAINDGHGQYYAPSAEAFWVFPDRVETSHETFTITIVPSDSTARSLAESEYEYAEGEHRTIRRTTVAGHEAFEVKTQRESDFIADFVIVQWDDRTAVKFELFSFRSDDLDARRARFRSTYRSLIAAPRDRFAGVVESFLRARIDGSGAERFLSSRALAKFRKRGELYGGTCGDIESFTVLSVIHDQRLGTLYVVEPNDIEVLQVRQTGHGGKVIDYAMFKECQTS